MLAHEMCMTHCYLFFSGAQSNVAPNEVNIQPMQVSNNDTDQPISDADLHDALVDERQDIEESRNLPKWSVQTLRDNRLDAPLSSRTRSCSHSVSYVSDCYALAISSLCDESKPVTFDEAQSSKN